MVTLYQESIFQDLSSVMVAELGITPILKGKPETFPMVKPLCKERFVTDGEPEQYHTVDADGNTHVHKIDYRETMLIKISPRIAILTDEIQEIVDIENVVTKMYSEPRNLFIAHPNIAGEKLPFQVVLDTSKKIQRRPFGTDWGEKYLSEIPLKPTMGVSFYKIPHPAQLALDKKLAVSTLERIIAVGRCWRNVGSALELLKSSELRHAEKGPKGWYMVDDDLQDEAVREKIRTDSNLKDLWPQIEKYPQMNTQDLCAQLEADKAELWSIYSELMEQTQILPKELWGEEEKSMRLIRSSTSIYAKEACDIDTAIQKAKDKEKKLGDQLDRLFEKDFPGMFQTSAPEPGSFKMELIEEVEGHSDSRQEQEEQERSSRSFLGDTLSTAFGVAIGNKLSGVGKRERKEDKPKRGRQSLWGTAMCPYGKKKGSWTIHCDISCPLYHECGGKP